MEPRNPKSTNMFNNADPFCRPLNFREINSEARKNTNTLESTSVDGSEIRLTIWGVQNHISSGMLTISTG